MSEPKPTKLGVLLFNLGGPDTLDAVRPFLFNLFADKDIIQLPGPQWLQNLLAWRISSKRYKEAQENYHGIGGGSPIGRFTKAQAALLEARLNELLPAHDMEAKTYVAMRYWHPFCNEALQAMQADGVERILLLPLYPHYSLATTGSSLNDYKRQKLLLEKASGFSFKQEDTVCAFYDDPLYLKAMAETIAQGLQQGEWSCPPEDVTVLFSAHGLPVSFVKKNRDPYPKQILQTAMRVMQEAFPNNRWQMCYQSKVGPLKWLEPATEKLLATLAKEKQDNFLVVPISFVSDHIETLYELDQLYIPEAREAGLAHIHRAPALNESAAFIEALAQLALRTLTSGQPCRLRLPILGEAASPYQPATTCGVS
jgi:protoporphyrin/coproporphyrin ferrochelatase